MIFRSGPQSQYARELQIQSFRRYNIIKRRAFCSIPSCRHYSLHQSAGLSIIWHYLAATSLFWARKGFLCRRTDAFYPTRAIETAAASGFSIYFQHPNFQNELQFFPNAAAAVFNWFRNLIDLEMKGGRREREREIDRERERERDQNRSLKTNWSIKTGSLRVSILGFGNRGSHCRFDWRLIGWRMWRWNVFWC